MDIPFPRKAAWPPRGFTPRSTKSIIGLFFCVAIIVYGVSLKNGFVDYDDSLLIYDNLAVIQPFTGTSIAWAFTHYDPELYIPLTFLSLQFDSFIGGMHPFIFHLHNLVLHTLNALLVAWFIALLAGDKGDKSRIIAIVCGLIFLVHPLNTETVAWASARKDALSTLLFLLSLVTYIQRKQAFSFIAFVLALLAKVTVAPLPLILLLIDWYKKGKVTQNEVINKVPYFAAAILFGLIGILGKDVILAETPLHDVILLIPREILLYLQKIFVPARLSLFYLYDPASVTITNSFVFVPLLLLLPLLLLIILSLRRTKTIVFGAAFFLIMLAPSFLHVMRGTEPYLASNRYAYVPMIGVLVIVASVLMRVRAVRWNVLLSVCALVLVALGGGALARSLVWNNTRTLFEDSLNTGETWLAYSKIGVSYLEEGDHQTAVEMLKRSIELKPNADAYYNMSVAAIELGLRDDALSFLREALAVGPYHPQAHINLSSLLWEDGQTEEAIDHAEKAVQYAPHNMMALGNLASMYALTDQEEKARVIIDEILALDPGNERVKAILEKLGIEEAN